MDKRVPIRRFNQVDSTKSSLVMIDSLPYGFEFDVHDLKWFD
jgi:hypothetical protein